MEHKYPNELPLPGQCAKLEFEYIRHYPASLIGFFDVVTGRMEMPYLNSTRIEDDFVKAVKALTETDPQAPWTFICDGLPPISRKPLSDLWQRKENEDQVYKCYAVYS